MSVSPAATVPTTASAGANVSPDQKRRAVAAATGAFVLEALLYVLKNAYVTAEKEAERRLAVEKLSLSSDWDSIQVDTELSLLMGRCDLCFKASESSDERVTKWRHLLHEAGKCRVQSRGEDEFIGIDEDDILGGLLSETMALDYGVRSGIERQADQVRTEFTDAFKLRTSLINVVLQYKMLTKPSDSSIIEYPLTVSGAISTLRESLKPDSKTVMPSNVRTKFVPVMLKSHNAMVRAKASLLRLSDAVLGHVSARQASGRVYFSYEFLGADIIASIAELAGYRNASALLRMSSEFSRDENIKKLRPHLSIRSVPRWFPHAEHSLPGIGNTAVIVKCNLVYIVIDLVVCGIKRDGVTFATRQHVDPWAGWKPEDMDRRSVRMARAQDLSERNSRFYSEESVSDGRFKVRLSALNFFQDELDCNVELVNADTGEPVNSLIEDTLQTPRSMTTKLNRLKTYTARDMVPYPAHTAFNVNCLIFHRKEQRYMFRVTATGTTKPRGSTLGHEKKLVAYSKPFVVMANKRKLKRKHDHT